MNKMLLYIVSLLSVINFFLLMHYKDICLVRDVQQHKANTETLQQLDKLVTVLTKGFSN